MTPRLPTAEQLAVLRRTFGERRPMSRADFAGAAAVACTTDAQARRAWAKGWPADGISPLEVELGTARGATVAVVKAEVVAQEAVARAAALGREVGRLEPLVGRLVARLANVDVADTAPVFALEALRSVVTMYTHAGRIASDAVELEQRITASRPMAPTDRYAEMTDEELLAEGNMYTDLLVRSIELGAIVVDENGAFTSRPTPHRTSNDEPRRHD